MQDPPREEAKAAIKKMFGGSYKNSNDHRGSQETAMAVAKEAGLLKGGKAVTGSRA